MERLGKTVTIRLKDKEVLYADALENFDFCLNSEKGELEVYNRGNFIGYYNGIIGISEESLREYVENCWKQTSEESKDQHQN